MKQINSRIQLKVDTATNWTSSNPTLLMGEVGFESDTGRYKVGDGVTNWVSLEYKNEENTARIARESSKAIVDVLETNYYTKTQVDNQIQALTDRLDALKIYDYSYEEN